MADTVKKFVDFSGLDYFWAKAKNYIDGIDATQTANISTNATNISKLQTTVGDATSGLVKDVTDVKSIVGNQQSGLVADVKAIQDELDSLSGGAGSIDTQITNKLATLTKGDAAETGKYVSAVSQENGIITVVKADLPDYTETYDAKGDAAKALADAKDYTDGKDSAMNTRVTALEASKDAYVDADAQVLADAKAYTNSLASNYDAAGAADDALADAKAYTDSLANGAVADNTAAIAVLNGTGAGSVDAKIDAAFNDFATKVSDDNVVNTYKELIDYAADHGSEFTELIGVVNSHAQDIEALEGDVATLKAIDHDAYKAADATVLADAKSYADGKDTAMNARVEVLEAINHDAYKAADTALETSLKAYADASETDAVATAKSYTDGEITKLANVYDAKGAANSALVDAKSYADGLAVNYDAKGAAAGALTDAKAYTDTKNTAMNTRVAALEAIDHDAYIAADNAIKSAYADADATVLSDAKKYTDDAIAGFTFATNADIDSLFV